MVAVRTAPTDRTCTHCGAQESAGARFKRWSLVCNACRNRLRRAQYTAQDALPEPPPPPLTAGIVTPVRYVLHRLGPCPSFDRQPAAARHYYAAIARVAREMGYPEQAQEWATLSTLAALGRTATTPTP